GPLRGGGPGAFKQRLVLAATMSPSYGIYGGYELMENEPYSEESEEYLNSEKYEIRNRNWEDPSSLGSYIARINAMRQKHPCLRWLKNIRFQGSSNDHVIAYSKHTHNGTGSPQGTTGETGKSEPDVLLIVINLSTTEPSETTLTLDLPALGLPAGGPFDAHEELTNTTFVWQGPNPYVWLDRDEPAQIFHLRRRS
ncbi:MAG: alpha-1,4-glucan--maltose-1-phosphate maltosyltransferase, partial [Acidimicrobiia bacterium]